MNETEKMILKKIEDICLSYKYDFIFNENEKKGEIIKREVDGNILATLLEIHIKTKETKYDENILGKICFITPDEEETIFNFELFETESIIETFNFLVTKLKINEL